MGIDAKVGALLREAAGDSTARLLRIGAAALEKSLSESDPGEGVVRSLLSRAEREILRAHREEVAWILRLSSRRIRRMSTVQARIAPRFRPDDSEVALPTPAELTSRSERLRSAATPDRESDALLDEALGLLERPGDLAAATRLEAAALRLDPASEGKVGLGMALVHEGRYGEAERAFGEVLAGYREGQAPVREEVNLALAQAKQGAIERAADRIRGACELPDAGVMVLLYDFGCSLRLERREASLRAAGALEERGLDEADPRVEAYAGTLIASRRAGDWVPSEGTRGLIRSIDSKLSPATGRIVHALL